MEKSAGLGRSPRTVQCPAEGSGRKRNAVGAALWGASLEGYRSAVKGWNAQYAAKMQEASWILSDLDQAEGTTDPTNDRVKAFGDAHVALSKALSDNASALRKLQLRLEARKSQSALGKALGFELIAV